MKKSKNNDTIILDGEYDYIDLVNILLSSIIQQPVMTEEDRRIINHLNECLFQLNLKSK